MEQELLYKYFKGTTSEEEERLILLGGCLPRESESISKRTHAI